MGFRYLGLPLLLLSLPLLVTKSGVSVYLEEEEAGVEVNKKALLTEERTARSVLANRLGPLGVGSGGGGGGGRSGSAGGAMSGGGSAGGAMSGGGSAGGARSGGGGAGGARSGGGGAGGARSGGGGAGGARSGGGGAGRGSSTGTPYVAGYNPYYNGNNYHQHNRADNARNGSIGLALFIVAAILTSFFTVS